MDHVEAIMDSIARALHLLADGSSSNDHNCHTLWLEFIPKFPLCEVAKSKSLVIPWMGYYRPLQGHPHQGSKNNFRIVSGHDDRPNSFCSVRYRFWPVKCVWWITLLGAHKPKMKNWKLLIKVEIFGNFVTGSGRIPMSVSMREL